MELQTPNSAERSIWNAARRKLEDATRRYAIARARLNYAMIISEHAAEFGITTAISSEFLINVMKSLSVWNDMLMRIGVVMDAAERGELAARPSAAGGDLDVVAPSPLDPKWEPYLINPGEMPPTPELGIAPLIVLGIIVAVVIGGILTVTSLSNTAVKKMDRDIELATIQAETQICQDPNSPVCAAWLQKKKTKPVKQTLSAIDYLFGKGSGKKIAGGLGLAIGLGLAFWALSRAPKRAS